MLQNRPRLRWALIAVVFLLGAVPQIAHLLHRGAVWGDEAALALNIGPRGFLDMGSPFILRQVCPWLTMAGIKATTAVLGTDEIGYRAFATLAALTATALAYPLGRRLGGPVAGLVAMLLVGTSAGMVRYAAELKQYSTDAAVAAILALGTLRVLEAPGARGRLAFLALSGVAAGWMSLPSLFVLAACGLALVLESLEARRGLRPLLVLGAIGAAWLASFYVHYRLYVASSELANSPGVALHWKSAFAPFPPTSLADLRWYAGKFTYTFEDPLGASQRYLAAVLFLVGAFALFRAGRRPALVAMLGPWAFAVVASMMGRYPPVSRLMLFMVPALGAMVGAGVAALVQARPLWVRAGALALALGLAAPGVPEAWAYVPPPPPRQDLKAVLRRVSEVLEPGDVVYVAERGNGHVWDFYAEAFGLPPEFVWLNDVRDFEEPGRYHNLPKVGWLFGHRRVWMLLPNHPEIWDPIAFAKSAERFSAFITRYVDRSGGRRLSEERFDKHTLYLYDLRAAHLPPGEARYANPTP